MLLFNWENLSLIGKLYWIFAIPSTAIFAILMILSFFGADGDADIDDGSVDIGEGFGGFILSFKSLISFMMMFGWAGIISHAFNLNTILTIIIAFITGLVSLLAVAGLLYFFSKMSYSGTMELENAIGKEGQVVLRIPAKKSGSGQVQLNVQGSFRTLDAVTEEPEEIKSGTNVQVIDIVNTDTLLVVPKR
ncbi:MAG: NfeD family protein [Bacteroidales bacterium]|nr:NfeD family protein [Bacteroidales bacterium]